MHSGSVRTRTVTHLISDLTATMSSHWKPGRKANLGLNYENIRSMKAVFQQRLLIHLSGAMRLESNKCVWRRGGGSVTCNYMGHRKQIRI